MKWTVYVIQITMALKGLGIGAILGSLAVSSESYSFEAVYITGAAVVLIGLIIESYLEQKFERETNEVD